MTTVSRPKLTVEGAFVLPNASSDDRIWSNVSDYIDLDEGPVSIAQRRPGLFEEPSPGTLSFVVDNSSGAFTDTNASSPFYPGVTQNAPLRARLQYPSTVNLLSGALSRTDDPNPWTAEEGDVDTDTSAPPSGTSCALTWATGALETLGVHVAMGQGAWSMPGDEPVYVKSGEAYSARVQIKCTGTLSVSLRMAWYDLSGTLVREDSSSVLGLTTSYQNLSITNKVAPGDGSVRIAIANETTVGPSARGIANKGGVSYTDQWVTSRAVRLPANAAVNDVVLMFRRISDPADSFNAVTGWTQIGSTTADARGKTRIDYHVVGPNEAGKKYVTTWGANKCRSYVALVVYSGVLNSGPVNASTFSAETILRTTHTTPNVTSTVANCWILSAVFDTSSTTTSFGLPGAEILREYGNTVRGNSVAGIITDDGIVHVAGTYGSKVFTASKASRFATMHTIALAPNAAATGAGSVTVSMGTPILVKDTTVPTYVAGGDWHYLIAAYADSFEPYWQLERALVGVAATDRSKLLEGLTVGPAIVEAELDADPVVLYRLDEEALSASTAAEASDSSGLSQPALFVRSYGAGYHPVNDPSISWGSGKGPGSDGTPALQLAPTNSTTGTALVVEGLSTPIGDCPGISVVFNWKSSQVGVTETSLLKIAPTTGSSSARCYLEFYHSPGTGYLGLKYKISSDQTGNVVTFAQQAVNWADGNTHTIGGVVQIVSNFVQVGLYVDGVLVSQQLGATTTTALPPMDAMCVGGAYNNARLSSGTFSNIAVFNSILSDDDMAMLFTAADTGFSGDSVTDRLARLMDWKDLAGADFDFSAATCSRHMPDEMSLLDAMRLPVATDGGTLFMGGQGDVTFRCANTKELQAAPVLTLAAGDLAEAPRATQDDALLVNDITVNRLGNSTSQRLTDPDSMAAFGPHDRSIDTLLQTGKDARAMAGYWIAFFAQPITRFDSLSVEALLLADWTALLSVDMWEIIRITGLPSTAPASQLDSHMEGVQWDISTDSWLVTFDVSYAIPFAVIGDAARGLMGSNVVGL